MFEQRTGAKIAYEIAAHNLCAGSMGNAFHIDDGTVDRLVGHHIERADVAEVEVR